MCQNLFSQIEGDGNAVNIIGVQTGGERRTTTPSEPPTEPPTEPGPETNLGSVEVNVIALACVGTDFSICPKDVDDLQFAVSDNSLSPTEFNGDDQTINFAVPSTFEVELISPIPTNPDFVSVTTESERTCSNVPGNQHAVTGNIPQAGGSIICQVSVTYSNLD